MGIAATEKELAERASRFLKAEMKRAGVTYEVLADSQAQARHVRGHVPDRRYRSS